MNLCREQVRVNGFGMFFMAVYPGAFVDLYTEHLTVISPMRQLRIYCAGVWHNAVLVLVGLVFLWSLPYLLVPIYVTGQGAVVLNVLKVSYKISELIIHQIFSLTCNCFKCIMRLNIPQLKFANI